MTQTEFFSTNWHRSTLLSELGMPDDSGSYIHGVTPGFEELRNRVAIKHFGEAVVNSVEFQKLWAADMVDMLTRVRYRDLANYSSKTPAQKKKSNLLTYVAEHEAEIAEWRKKM